MVNGPVDREDSDPPFPGPAARTSDESQDSATVSLHRLTQRKVLEVLIRGYGKKKGVEMLCEAGLLAGVKLVRKALGQGADFRRFAAFLQEDLADQRIGVLRIESFDPDAGNLVMHVIKGIGNDGVPESDKAIFVYDEGFIHGVLAGIQRAYPDKRYAIWTVSPDAPPVQGYTPRI